MAYNFHYTPTGTGVISGKEVLEQTEDAINDLGNTAISGVQEALDKAEQALTNSENAVDDAQTALNTANNAEGVAIQAQTDVGNLSGTVTNIGNRVTTAEGNITNLQGRMTTAEGNITNLQGRMTTAETNIGNLQTAVSTAQATANSAQQTATTARQQSYVFRYSGTAVVPNSTIAYSTIDNTDNIKSGDKILDVDGKLFEITAVDTTNQTVTVGSALIDLALDANVVHTSGNETISGDKVFNNRLIKNIDVVLGTAPSTGKFSNIDIADNNKASLLQILGGVYDTGNSYARFFIQNKTADDGTGLSPTGTIRTCGFNINLPATSTSEGQGSITPRANKATDFGLLSYQWRTVWCEKLFLNGTQLDPSAFALDANVVHNSGNETVGGQKTFSDNLSIYNADNSVDTPRLNIKTSKYVKGDTTNTDTMRINFLDSNGNNVASVYANKNTSGSQYLSFQIYTTDNNNANTTSSINYYISKSGDKFFVPYEDNQISLGGNVRRWKSVYATNYYYGSDNTEFSTKFVTTDTNQTISGNKTFSSINGVEPSSLSLPSDRSARIDISSYFTNTGNNATNNYSVLANGYIFLKLNNINQITCYSTDSSSITNYAQTYTRPSDGVLYITFPVRKNDNFRTIWNTGSSVSVESAYFIPCQGNV